MAAKRDKRKIVLYLTLLHLKSLNSYVSFFLFFPFFFTVCPNGIVNMTGSTTGTLVHPSSGNYGINETKCWRIEVPKPYVGIAINVHRYSFFAFLNIRLFALKHFRKIGSK